MAKNKKYQKIILGLLFITKISFSISHNQIVTIVGSGYVGLTLAAVLLEQDHTITCIDIDKDKINGLNKGHLHIYEPFLEELLLKNSRNNKISFKDTLLDAKKSDIYYLCVPTPLDKEGNCDLSYLYKAFSEVIEIAENSEDIIICVKSTVPPGTMQRLKNILENKKRTNSLIYNPEFMREGTAIADIYANPIIIGGESLKGIEKIETINRGFSHKNDVACIKTSFITAEMIKYSWNSYAALRITFINELASLSRILGSSIIDITKALSLNEELLATAAIKAGPGFGGSCLPKDTQAFLRIFELNNFSSSIMNQIIESNKNHKQKIIEIIINELEKKKNPQIVTLWGLSFKAETNDVRYSPAIDIIQALLQKNIKIQAYDPKANSEMKKLFPEVVFYDSAYEAARKSDYIIALTEWEEIKNIDLSKIAEICNQRNILDTRNLYNPLDLKKFDFSYINMGRQ